MRHAKIINGEIVFYKSPLRIENTDIYIRENTELESEITLLLSQGFKSYREELGEVEGITETENEIVKTYIPAPIISLSAYDTFNAEKAVENLARAFGVTRFTLVAESNKIESCIRTRYFGELYLFISYLKDNGKITQLQFDDIVSIFSDQNIDLTSIIN